MQKSYPGSNYDGTSEARRTTSELAFLAKAPYGSRVALFLRRRLGYAASKKLAAILDVSTRRADALLEVKDRNRGPTPEQLLLLHAEFGQDLLDAVFIEEHSRRERIADLNDRIARDQRERDELISARETQFQAVPSARQMRDAEIASLVRRHRPPTWWERFTGRA